MHRHQTCPSRPERDSEAPTHRPSDRCSSTVGWRGKAKASPGLPSTDQCRMGQQVRTGAGPAQQPAPPQGFTA